MRAALKQLYHHILRIHGTRPTVSFGTRRIQWDVYRVSFEARKKLRKLLVPEPLHICLLHPSHPRRLPLRLHRLHMHRRILQIGEPLLQMSLHPMGQDVRLLQVQIIRHLHMDVQEGLVGPPP
jgi:hypothetical protein